MPTSLDTTPGEIVTRSRDGIRDQATADYQIRVPTADVGPQSLPYVDASVLADAEMFLVNDAVVIGRGTNLSTSGGAWLTLQGESRGVDKRPAKGAVGFVTVTTNSGGALIQAKTEVKDPRSGLRFEVAATQLYTSATPVPIKGIDTGPVTDLLTGTAMQFTAPPPGVGQNCVVAYPGLSGGLNEDDDATYRILIEETLANPPASGNDAAYQEAIEKTPGVGVEKGFTWPAVRGTGTTAYGFTLRGVTLTDTRIPNDAEVALVESWVKGQFPADDGGFACVLMGQAVTVALKVTWASPAPTWVDAVPWPPYVPVASPPETGADKVKVAAAPAPTTTSCRLTTTTAGSVVAPQVAQTIGFFDRAAKVFRRKRILTVAVVVVGKSWDVTFDTVNNASDLTYAPAAGSAASPWSDSLDTLVPPLAAPFTGFFNTLGPGEQVASFPDPGARQRRSPQSPAAWPNIITARIQTPLFALTSIEDLTLEEPVTPLATTVGVAGVSAYLMGLGDLCAFVK